MFEKITACLDMFGCPNRCRHCWLGLGPNGNLTVDDLVFVAKSFRPFIVKGVEKRSHLYGVFFAFLRLPPCLPSGKLRRHP